MKPLADMRMPMERRVDDIVRNLASVTRQTVCKASSHIAFYTSRAGSIARQMP
jgi:hypothetical protein